MAMTVHNVWGCWRSHSPLVLAEFEPSTAVRVAEELDDQALTGIVEEMAPDDAARGVCC